MAAMKKNFWTGVLGVAATALVVGCGGYDTQRDRFGEGNIPVGRVISRRSAEAAVTIETDSGVRRTTVTNSGGIFKFDELPVGGATLTVEPMDPQLERESLRIYFGAEQRMIANVGVNDRNIVAVVESLEISMPSGTVVAPGSRTPFVVRVSGQNVQSLIPSIWVDGGIGSLGAGNQFIASVPGTGKIRVRVLGREAELNVTVQ